MMDREIERLKRQLEFAGVAPNEDFIRNYRFSGSKRNAKMYKGGRSTSDVEGDLIRY